MLPITPISPYMRPAAFCVEEWDAYFSGTRIDQIAGGWRGILRANQAIFDPKASWDFFANDSFLPEWLDGGASRTWYLAFAGGEFVRYELSRRAHANLFSQCRSWGSGIVSLGT